jgi:hypothetical protein
VAAADRAQLIAELVLDDKFTKPLNRIDKRLGAFSGAVNRNLGRGIDSAVTAVARGVVNIGKSVTSAAIEWEDAFQGVVKTVDTTPEKMDEIALAIRNMATEMPVAAAELAAIAEMGGAMGIEAEGIEEFTRQVRGCGGRPRTTSEHDRPHRSRVRQLLSRARRTRQRRLVRRDNHPRDRPPHGRIGNSVRDL